MATREIVREPEGDIKETLIAMAYTKAEWRDDLQVVAAREEIDEVKITLDHCEKNLKVVEAKYAKKISSLEDRLISQVCEIGSSVDYLNIIAQYTAAHVRVSYDRKKVDAILVKNPAISEIINPARSESPVDERVKVKWGNRLSKSEIIDIVNGHVSVEADIQDGDTPF